MDAVLNREQLRSVGLASGADEELVCPVIVGATTAVNAAASSANTEQLRRAAQNARDGIKNRTPIRVLGDLHRINLSIEQTVEERSARRCSGSV